MDWDVLIAGGMGQGVCMALNQYNIRPIVTDISQIEDAVAAYLEGKLDNREDLIH